MEEKGLDEIRQKMLNDGIDQNLFTKTQDHYFQCALDMEQFTIDNPPTLLECGHVICEKCIQRGQKFCPDESFTNDEYELHIGLGVPKKPFKIKQRPYKTLLTYIDTVDNNQADKKSFYIFSMSCLGSSATTMVFQHVPADNKWEDLLFRSPNFSDFSRQPNTAVSLTINNQAFLLDHIRNQKIVDLTAHGKKLMLLSEETNRVNNIIYSNKNLGG